MSDLQVLIFPFSPRLWLKPTFAPPHSGPRPADPVREVWIRPLLKESAARIMVENVAFVNVDSSFPDLLSYSMDKTISNLARDTSFVDVLFSKEGVNSDSYYAFIETLVDKLHDYFNMNARMRKQASQHLLERRMRLPDLLAYFSEVQDVTPGPYVPGRVVAPETAGATVHALHGPYPVPSLRGGRSRFPSMIEDEDHRRATSTPPTTRSAPTGHLRGTVHKTWAEEARKRREDYEAKAAETEHTSINDVVTRMTFAVDPRAPKSPTDATSMPDAVERPTEQHGSLERDTPSRLPEPSAPPTALEPELANESTADDFVTREALPSHKP